MNQAKLTSEYWEDASTTAVYLINRLFKTPLQILFNKLPDYKFLKVLDAPVFHSSNLTTHTKWTIDLLNAFFLGIAQVIKAYKCLDRNGKLYISRDMSFDEYKFPFELLFKAVSESLNTSCNPFMPIASLPILYSKPQSINSIPVPNSNSTVFAGTNDTSLHS